MTAAERVTFERLEQENQELRARVAALEELVRGLQQQRQELQEKLDEQLRAAARQAAPFRRRQRLKIPSNQKKRLGRWRPSRPSSSSSRTCRRGGPTSRGS
jgi:hypothetical protein